MASDAMKPLAMSEEREAQLRVAVEMDRDTAQDVTGVEHLLAEVDALRAKLAETVRPGARRYVCEPITGSRNWRVVREDACWVETVDLYNVLGPEAEQRARSLSARLNAEAKP